MTHANQGGSVGGWVGRPPAHQLKIELEYDVV